MFDQIALPQSPTTNVLAPAIRPYGAPFPPPIAIPVAGMLRAPTIRDSATNSTNFEQAQSEPNHFHAQVDTYRAIQDRVAALYMEACADGEAVNDASLLKMITFFNETNLSVKPAIFLLDSGNFKVQWKKDREVVSIEFFPTDKVNYLLFLKGRQGSMDRMAGASDIHLVKQILKVTGAKKLFS